MRHFWRILKVLWNLGNNLTGNSNSLLNTCLKREDYSCNRKEMNFKKVVIYVDLNLTLRRLNRLSIFSHFKVKFKWISQFSASKFKFLPKALKFSAHTNFPLHQNCRKESPWTTKLSPKSRGNSKNRLPTRKRKKQTNIKMYSRKNSN